MTAAQRSAASALEAAGAKRIVPTPAVLAEVQALLSDAVAMWAARLDTENPHTFLSRMTLSTEEEEHDRSRDLEEEGDGASEAERKRKSRRPRAPSPSWDAATRRLPGHMLLQFLRLLAFGTAKPIAPRRGAEARATVGSESFFASSHTGPAIGLCGLEAASGVLNALAPSIANEGKRKARRLGALLQEVGGSFSPSSCLDSKERMESGRERVKRE